MSKKSLLLEDFLDDVESKDVIKTSDVEVEQVAKDSEEMQYTFQALVQDDSHAMEVCHQLERYLETVPEISEFDVSIYSNPKEANFKNLFNTSDVCLIVGFSLKRYFPTPLRALAFADVLWKLGYKFEDSVNSPWPHRSVFRKNSTWNVIVQSNTYDYLKLSRQIKDKVQLTKKDFDNTFFQTYNDIYNLLGEFTNHYERVAKFLSESLGYYKHMTRKLAHYMIKKDIKLKLCAQSVNFLENHPIDLSELYKTQRYVSAEFYLPAASNIHDFKDRLFIYSPQHINDHDVADARAALAKLPEVKLQHVCVAYDKDVSSYVGWGSFRLTAFLCAYAKDDDEDDELARDAENIFLMITGNRKQIDVFVQYLERCFGETLPNYLTDDFFAATIK